MAPKKIMLLGSTGQVGQALRAQPLPEGFDLKPYSHVECDITDHRAVQRELQKLRPDLLINTAALTSVDQCERDLDLARRVNFDGVANLAAQCASLDLPLIHLSSDYVFDGKGSTPYKPGDAPHPLNAYGESKMLGEEALRHEHAWHVILRTSSIFSAFGNNFLTRLIDTIDRPDEIRAARDQIASPTPATDLAEVLITISTALLKGKVNGFGTYHYTGEPALARDEFTHAVMDAYAPYTKHRPKIVAVASTELASRAPRPLYSVLDCTKIDEIYGIKQKPWRGELKTAIEHMVHDRRHVA